MTKDNLGIKNWVLTPHAVDRLKERSISLTELEEIIKSPDIVKAQGPKYILAKELIGRSDNKVACVVLERKENDLWIVITVMTNFREN